MSNEVKTKEKVNMDPKYIIELTVKLFVTCVVVAGLLGLVNSVTAGPIAEINKAKTEEAMKAVVADPEGSTFSDALELTAEMTDAALAGGGTLTEAYEVLVGGAPAGHAGEECAPAGRRSHARHHPRGDRHGGGLGHGVPGLHAVRPHRG